MTTTNEIALPETLPLSETQIENELAALLDITPETIVDANEAVGVFGDLLCRIVDEYNHNPTASFDTPRELEEAAFSYYKLGNIEDILDYLQTRADTVQHIHEIIDAAPIREGEVLPVGTRPESAQSSVKEQSRKVVEHATESRLETLLYILKNRFDIDNKEELAITGGVLNRKRGSTDKYYFVTIPKLNRLILICNTHGNITYIVDTDILNKGGIEPEELWELSKPDIDDLLKTTPHLGERVIYNNDKFITDITEALSNPLDQQPLPHAPASNLSINRMSEVFDVDEGALARAISALTEDESAEFGEIGEYPTGISYTTTQQIMICRHLEKLGYFTEPPEDYRNMAEITIWLELPSTTTNKRTRRAIDELGDALGKPLRARRKGCKLCNFYSPDQQRMIRDVIAQF